MFTKKRKKDEESVLQFEESTLNQSYQGLIDYQNENIKDLKDEIVRWEGKCNIVQLEKEKLNSCIGDLKSTVERLNHENEMLVNQNRRKCQNLEEKLKNLSRENGNKVKELRLELNQKNQEYQKTLKWWKEMCEKEQTKSFSMSVQLQKLNEKNLSEKSVPVFPETKDTNDDKLKALQSELSKTKIENEQLVQRLMRLEQEKESTEHILKLKDKFRSEIDELKNLRHLTEQQRKKIQELEAFENQYKESQETIHSLNLDVSVLKEHISFNTKYDEEEEQKLEELMTWRNGFHGMTPSEAVLKFHKLQTELEQMRIVNSKFEIQVRELSSSNKTMKNDILEAKKQIAQLKTELEYEQEKLDISEHKCVLQSKDLLAKKNLLESYTSEHEMAEKVCIEGLENLVKDRDQEILSLNEKLSTFSKKVKEQSEQISLLKLKHQEQLNSIEAKYKEAQQFQILHLGVNPQIIRSSEASTNELNQLRSKVKILENQLEQMRTAPTPSLMLYEKQEEFSKRLTRHNKVFQEKIAEFRSVIYKLFGYRIDAYENNYQLISKYTIPSNVIHFRLKRKPGKSQFDLELLDAHFLYEHPKVLHIMENKLGYPLMLAQLQLDLKNQS